MEAESRVAAMSSKTASLVVGPEDSGSFFRDAFDAVAGGETLKHAAQRLGLRDSHLSYILHTRTYAGQDGAEPLVSPDVFEQVCDRLEANLVTKTGTKRFNLLRGLVTCQCGFSFVGDAGGRGRYYYRCDSFGHREKSCGAAMLEANRFEAFVWSQCLEILNDPHSIFNDTVLVDLEQETCTAARRSPRYASNSENVRSDGISSCDRPLLAASLRARPRPTWKRFASLRPHYRRN